MIRFRCVGYIDRRTPELKARGDAIEAAFRVKHEPQWRIDELARKHTDDTEYGDGRQAYADSVCIPLYGPI